MTSDPAEGGTPATRARTGRTPEELERIRRGAGIRPIYLWGTGQAGRRVARFCRRSSFTLRGFVDSDPSRQGQEIEGLAAYGPEQLTTFGFQPRPFVLVCSVYFEQIARTLSTMGFLEEEDFVDFSDIGNVLPPESGGLELRVPPFDLWRLIDETEIDDRRRQQMDRVRRLAASRPVYVWGMDAVAQEIAWACRKTGCPLDGFIDVEATAQGQRFANTFVFSPDSLRVPASQAFRPFVLVGPNGSDAVRALLQDFGLCESTDFLVLH